MFVLGPRYMRGLCDATGRILFESYTFSNFTPIASVLTKVFEKQLQSSGSQTELTFSGHFLDDKTSYAKRALDTSGGLLRLHIILIHLPSVKDVASWLLKYRATR